jgi:hypothetical protein
MSFSQDVTLGDFLPGERSATSKLSCLREARLVPTYQRYCLIPEPVARR